MVDREDQCHTAVLAKLIKTNEPLLDQTAQRQRDRIRTVVAAATLSKP
jgi:hypothetical protein